MTRQRMDLDGERDFSRPAVAPRRGEAHADGSTPRRFRVPGPWQAQFDDLRDYSGVVWYRRTFELTNDERRTTNDERWIDRSLVACPERSRRVGRWSLVVALLLSACGNTHGSVQPGAARAVGEASAIPAATIVRTPIPTPGPNEFVNPVLDQNFPDPDVLKVGDTYYAYATESGSITIQSARSSNLVEWQMLGNALIVLPPWVKPGFDWAPDVSQAADGKTFVMYFAARDAASDRQCIGVATSDTPEGPFKYVGDKPLICQLELGGSIDPASFVDEDGARYVLWKNDGNCCGLDTYIYVQTVSADGLTLEGEPTKLIKNDKPWEGAVVEAPTLWKHGGKYYLFYSANNYAGVDYATGYAVADTITGPYTKPSKGPLLASDLQHGAAIGPGGQDVVLDKKGETWLVFHSWDPTATYRRLMLEQLVWEGATPVVKGPNRGPQPKP